MRRIRVWTRMRATIVRWNSVILRKTIHARQAYICPVHVVYVSTDCVCPQRQTCAGNVKKPANNKSTRTPRRPWMELTVSNMIDRSANTMPFRQNDSLDFGWPVAISSPQRWLRPNNRFSYGLSLLYRTNRRDENVKISHRSQRQLLSEKSETWTLPLNSENSLRDVSFNKVLSSGGSEGGDE